MDVINPLSLLEVTMGGDINEDDDCIVIEDNDDIQEDEVTLPSFSSVSRGECVEVEIDPLMVDPSYQNGKQSNMTTLWVTTNINNLAYTSHAEAEFRKKKYQNIYEVLKEELHCTICRDHVGCDIRVHPNSIEHPVLKVLVCQKCNVEFKTLHFVMNEKGKEINCRWCGKTEERSGCPLRTCQQCPFSFCEQCIFFNCSNYNAPRFPWICFVCQMRVLWPARATLWALHNLKSLLLGSSGNALAKVDGDISLCCKGKKSWKKKYSERVSKITNSNEVNPVYHEESHPLFYMLNGPSLAGNDAQQVKRHSGPKNGVKKTVRSKVRPIKAQPESKKKPLQPEKKSCIVHSKKGSSVPIIWATPEHQENFTPPESNQSGPSHQKNHWLRPKLAGYINDLDQLKIKLEEIEKTLGDEETSDYTSDKIDAITTLLSLHIDLLKSSRVNLMNEWKERKARAVLEQYDPSKQEIVHNGKILANQSLTIPVPKQKKNSSAVQKKRQARQRSNINKLKKEINDFGLKDCFVKLEKLEMPLPLDKQCVIKLERL